MNALLDSEISFALFRLPSESEPHMIIDSREGGSTISNILEITDYEGFVIAPFIESEDLPIVVIRPDSHLIGWESIENYLKSFKTTLSETIIECPKRKASSYDEYTKSFNIFHQALEKGEFSKLVLARTSKIERDASLSIWDLFRLACEKYNEAFVWIAKSKASGIWFGATPETLVEGDSSAMKTIALAGTERVTSSGTHREWSPARYLEQEIVSEYIRETLRGVTDSFDEVGPTTTTAGGVAHLKSTFRFKLSDDYSVGELLKKLHPTPAVCGIPKLKAIDFIRDNESINRRYYSGYAGYVSKNTGSNIFVNLRSMEILPDSFILYAGGGILKTSDVESEWSETEDKLQTLLSLLR
ncbi:MAG: isochorismate synthase [Bacteroidales bacterium]